MQPHLRENNSKVKYQLVHSPSPKSTTHQAVRHGRCCGGWGWACWLTKSEKLQYMKTFGHMEIEISIYSPCTVYFKRKYTTLHYQHGTIAWGKNLRFPSYLLTIGVKINITGKLLKLADYWIEELKLKIPPNLVPIKPLGMVGVFRGGDGVESMSKRLKEELK